MATVDRRIVFPTKDALEVFPTFQLLFNLRHQKTIKALIVLALLFAISTGKKSAEFNQTSNAILIWETTTINPV